MIEKIRNEMTEVLEEREGAGRADLVLLLHPRGDVLKALIAELGEGKAPERAAGIEIQYTRDVDEDEFQIVWRDDVTEEADE